MREDNMLSIYSICHNEGANCRAAWESVKGVDELVAVIDSRTTDKTAEIAREFTDKIFYFDWIDDFSAMKNFAASKCSNNWVMHVGGAKTLEEGGIEKIRSIIKEHGSAHDAFKIKLVSKEFPAQFHYLPHLYRKDRVEYSGAIHEALTKPGFFAGDVVITWGQNPNHKDDPERNVRILEKELAKVRSPRNIFYLAREYYFRARYSEAVELFEEYVGVSKFLAEKGDAYLLLSRCLFQLNRGDDARAMCLKAIQTNPMHEEALRFMADLHYEPWKTKWRKLADAATNEDVLFVVRRLDNG